MDPRSVSRFAPTSDKAQEVAKRIWISASQVGAPASDVLGAVIGVASALLLQLDEKDRRPVYLAIQKSMELNVFGIQFEAVPLSGVIQPPK